MDTEIGAGRLDGAAMGVYCFESTFCDVKLCQSGFLLSHSCFHLVV